MIWVDVTMDFIEWFPHVNRKSVILTVVDRFLKSIHFITLGHPYMATSVARAFFNTVVRFHGIPDSIVSDQDPVFTSQFWSELFALSDIKLHLSSASHPQSDG
jgi:transposase InsO family protein